MPPIECAHGMAADATKFISPEKILLMDKTLAVVMVIILWFFEFAHRVTCSLGMRFASLTA